MFSGSCTTALSSAVAHWGGPNIAWLLEHNANQTADDLHRLFLAHEYDDHYVLLHIGQVAREDRNPGRELIREPGLPMNFFHFGHLLLRPIFEWLAGPG